MLSLGKIILINPVQANERSDSPTTPINILLNFLKIQKISRPHKFSCSSINGVLIENMNLRDNLKLENQGINHSKLNVQTNMADLKNIYLNELIKKLGPLDLLPQQVDQQTRKLTSILKCFLTKADYLFFEFPELHLDHQNLIYLAKAMSSFAHSQTKNCFVYSDKVGFWNSYATHDLVRDPSVGLKMRPIEKKELVREIAITDSVSLNKVA